MSVAVVVDRLVAAQIMVDNTSKVTKMNECLQDEWIPRLLVASLSAAMKKAGPNNELFGGASPVKWESRGM